MTRLESKYRKGQQKSSIYKKARGKDEEVVRVVEEMKKAGVKILQEEE